MSLIALCSLFFATSAAEAGETRTITISAVPEQTADSVPIETFSLNFGKIDIEYAGFDGRFLRDGELSSAGDHVLAGGDLEGAELTLYLDGREIGTFDNGHGTHVSGTIGACPSSGVALEGHDGWIDVLAWQKGSGTMRFADGKEVAFDEYELRIPIDARSTGMTGDFTQEIWTQSGAFLASKFELTLDDGS